MESVLDILYGLVYNEVMESQLYIWIRKKRLFKMTDTERNCRREVLDGICAGKYMEICTEAYREGQA